MKLFARLEPGIFSDAWITLRRSGIILRCPLVMNRREFSLNDAAWCVGDHRLFAALFWSRNIYSRHLYRVGRLAIGWSWGAEPGKTVVEWS